MSDVKSLEETVEKMKNTIEKMQKDLKDYEESIRRSERNIDYILDRIKILFRECQFKDRNPNW